MTATPLQTAPPRLPSAALPPANADSNLAAYGHDISAPRGTIRAIPVGHGGTGPRLPTFGKGRICAVDDCTTILRSTRPGGYCSIHENHEAESEPIPTNRQRSGMELVPVADVLHETTKLRAILDCTWQEITELTSVPERTLYRIRGGKWSDPRHRKKTTSEISVDVARRILDVLSDFVAVDRAKWANVL